MNTLIEHEINGSYIANKSVDVSFFYEGVLITGTVEFFKDGRTDASMSTKSVLALRKHLGGAIPNELFFEVCELMHTAARKGEEILNLTQHVATQSQVEAGVVEPEEKSAIQTALTFNTLPPIEEIKERAVSLALIAKHTGCKKALIGGAPFLMSALETALRSEGIDPLYSFSVRSSIEEPDGNGGVRKIAGFSHAGFILAG